MKRKFNCSYKGEILSVNANGKVLVTFYELHDANRHKQGEFKILNHGFPVPLPLLDNNIKAVPGHPVCLDVVEKDDFYLVTIDIPGYSATSKFAKKSSS